MSSPRLPAQSRVRLDLPRLLGAVVLLVLLGWSLTSAGALWLAARAAALAGSPEPDPAAALETLHKARRLLPWEPRLMQLEGQLLERAAAGAAPSAAGPLLAAAAERYQAVLTRQPTSVYAMAALLRVALNTDTPAAIGDALFTRALRLGLWEPGAQRSLIETGLAAWAVLTPVQQEALVEVLVAGLRSQPDQVMASAARAGRWDLLGPIVEQLALDDPALLIFARRHAPADRQAR